MTTLTPAQAAILTPPAAQVGGVPIPNEAVLWGASVTLSNPQFDPVENPIMDAVFYAAMSAAKQGLYSGHEGAEHWNGDPLTDAQRLQLCQALSQSGEKLCLPIDVWGWPPSRVFFQASTQGLPFLTAAVIVNGIVSPDPSGYQFPVPAMIVTQNPDGTQSRSFDLSSYPAGYPLASWAIALLATPTLPGASNPIGVYEGGINQNGVIPGPGQLSSYYAPANGDTRATGTLWMATNGVEYLKTFQPGGQSYSQFGTGGSTPPVVWLQISAGVA